MKIQLVIDAESPAELSRLSEVLARLAASPQKPESRQTPETPAAGEPEVDEPAASAPEAEQAKPKRGRPPKNSPRTPMAAKMALADLQSAAAQFARSHGILALTQLLKEHGATKLTDVSPEGWAALHTALTEGA